MQKTPSSRTIFAASTGAVLIAASGFVAGRATAPPTTAAGSTASASSTVSVAASTTASAPRPTTTVPAASSVVATSEPALVPEIDRARAGDVAALKALDLRERSVDEAVALADGHAELARIEARELARELRERPELARDSSTWLHVYRLMLDESAATTLAGALATLDAPVVADLFFDLWRRASRGSRLGLLMEDLLLARGFKPKPTAALSVAFDLARATDCAAIPPLLDAIVDHGDDRAARELERRRCPFEGAAKQRAEEAFNAATARPFEPAWAPGAKPKAATF
ncbi:MAG: hypothetical protein U0271_24305 [Polyangiaceae bacterium]